MLQAPCFERTPSKPAGNACATPKLNRHSCLFQASTPFHPSNFSFPLTCLPPRAQARNERAVKHSLSPSRPQPIESPAPPLQRALAPENRVQARHPKQSHPSGSAPQSLPFQDDPPPIQATLRSGAPRAVQAVTACQHAFLAPLLDQLFSDRHGFVLQFRDFNTRNHVHKCIRIAV